MPGVAKKPKPFYKNLADTLEDVEGVSERQLRYWRSKGLFVPELGRGTKFFTGSDIQQLRLLKKLIVDLNLSIETVQRLVQSVEYPWPRFASYLNFLDLTTMHLVPTSDAFTGALANLLRSNISQQGLERYVSRMMLVAFLRMKRRHSGAGVYQVQRDELLEKIKAMDVMARAEEIERYDKLGDFYNAGWQLNPQLPNDPQMSQVEIEELVSKRRALLQGIEEDEFDSVPF